MYVFSFSFQFFCLVSDGLLLLSPLPSMRTQKHVLQHENPRLGVSPDAASKKATPLADHCSRHEVSGRVLGTGVRSPIFAVQGDICYGLHTCRELARVGLVEKLCKCR